MILAELLDDWARRATEAGEIHATASVEDIMRPMIQEARNLDDTPARSDTSDRLLYVKETAKRIARSRSWIYANQDTLPFIHKNSGRSIRCSERALERWMKLNPR